MALGPHSWRGFRSCFAELHDPRVQERCDHTLLDIVAVTLLASMCGADDWPEVEVFGRTREPWLRTFLELPNGIPSHDTFARVFGLVERQQFATGLFLGTQALHEATGGTVLAIDGKTARRSLCKRSELGALHLVTAWATRSGLTQGQVACAEKSNEITAIPELLALLDARSRALRPVVVRLKREVNPQRVFAAIRFRLAEQQFLNARGRGLELGLRRVDGEVRFDRGVRPVFEIGDGDSERRFERGRPHADVGGRVMRGDPLDPVELQFNGVVLDGRPVDVASQAPEGQVKCR
jgi:hypothetical protein